MLTFRRILRTNCDGKKVKFTVEIHKAIKAGTVSQMLKINKISCILDLFHKKQCHILSDWPKWFITNSLVGIVYFQKDICRVNCPATLVNMEDLKNMKCNIWCHGSNTKRNDSQLYLFMQFTFLYQLNYVILNQTQNFLNQT